MTIGYYAGSEGRVDDRLNYTDLVVYEPGFQWLSPGDLLLPLIGDGRKRWRVLTPLMLIDAVEGGDSLDLYCEPAAIEVPASIDAEDPRLGGWCPEPVRFPRRLPEAVAEVLGLGAFVQHG